MSLLINIALPDYNSILVMFDAINTYSIQHIYMLHLFQLFASAVNILHIHTHIHSHPHTHTLADHTKNACQSKYETANVNKMSKVRHPR